MNCKSMATRSSRRKTSLTSWMTMAMAITTRHPPPPPLFISSAALVAQRTAFVQVKQEELTDDLANTNTNSDYNYDRDGHLCVVCMDNERSCLYVPCNHLAVCVECDAGIMAASQPCPMCNTSHTEIDREGSLRRAWWWRA